jgi:hypothetical protein
MPLSARRSGAEFPRSSGRQRQLPVQVREECDDSATVFGSGLDAELRESTYVPKRERILRSCEPNRRRLGRADLRSCREIGTFGRAGIAENVRP